VGSTVNQKNMGKPKQPAHTNGGARRTLKDGESWNELDVLRPVAVGSNHDNWPCFVLKDAVIFDEDGELANLLHAEIDGPLTVRGQLEVDKEFKNLRTSSFTTNLELTTDTLQ
jgi:hypothetical protein